MRGELGTCTALKSARGAVLGEALSTRTPLAQLGFCHMASLLPCSASQSATPSAAHAVMMTCTTQRACGRSMRSYLGQQERSAGLSTVHYKMLSLCTVCMAMSRRFSSFKGLYSHGWSCPVREGLPEAGLAYRGGRSCHYTSAACAGSSMHRLPCDCSSPQPQSACNAQAQADSSHALKR